MALLSPFRALRPAPEVAAEVASVPYDVVNVEEARALVTGHPLSFLHVTRAEIDLPPATNPYDESVYAQAARSAAFVQAQAELTNATSQLRSAQRELLEEWAKQFDLPTRAELNSIHQQLRDLKAALHRG